MLRLATDLRNNGVDSILDQWDLVPGQDLSKFMEDGIVQSDRVLLVCSRQYVSKADAGRGGVGYERLIVTAEVVQSIDTIKFVPVLRNNSDKTVPTFLGLRLHIDFTDDCEYHSRLEELLRELLGTPASVKPPLGQNPFTAELAHIDEPVRQTSPTGITATGTQVLSDEWFESERVKADNGIRALGLEGAMELRFGLHEATSKSQIDLLNAVNKSQIHTFGWPIGVTLNNREEHRPRPFEDGIRAEISIKDSDVRTADSYDYWAMRFNGDFYLLQSLFEDQRKQGKIFFNTRIVRVTEALLFAANLYQNLGVPPEANFSVRIAHHGLSGRTLESSSATRELFFPQDTRESGSQAQIILTLSTVKDALVDHVQSITEPLFMLFDFQQFERQVYEDIVRRFERGEVS